MKPLGTVDTSLLLAEARQIPLHTGGVMLFKYPDGVHEEWLHETPFIAQSWLLSRIKLEAGA
jgi:hypothetical protein